MDSDSKCLQPELNDEQWLLIADLFPNKQMGAKAAPRLLRGHFLVLRSGPQWKDMPSRFPSYVICR